MDSKLLAVLLSLIKKEVLTQTEKLPAFKFALEGNKLLFTQKDKTFVVGTLPLLKGDKGPQGPQGPQGLRGPQGPKGEAGKDGKDGVNGKDGLNGLNGKDGKDGVDGKNGKDGLDGLDGKDGPPGPKGEKGDPGQDGISVVSANINAYSELELHLSNGKTITAGEVKGKTYLPQKSGILSMGSGGKSPTITNFSFNENEELVITLSNGLTLNAGKAPKSWIEYLSGTTQTPEFLSSIDEGDVWRYTYKEEILYRLIPTNPYKDAFYRIFDGTTVSDLVSIREQ